MRDLGISLTTSRVKHGRVHKTCCVCGSDIDIGDSAHSISYQKKTVLRAGSICSEVCHNKLTSHLGIFFKNLFEGSIKTYQK